MFPQISAIEIQNKIDLNEEMETESESLFTPASGQSHLAGLKWNLGVMAAIQHAARVDPYKMDVKDGTVVPAIEAVDWTGSSDIRPRLLDKATI